MKHHTAPKKWIQNLFLPSTIAVLLIISAACAPVYIPNVVNTPLLGDKGEFSASINAGTSAFDFQGAYAFGKQLAGMFNLSYAPKDDANGSQHFFAEGGIGFFKKMSKAGRFEVFAGYGMGKASSEVEILNSPDYNEGSYYRLFLQPTIGLVTTFFDGAFSLRAVYVDYSKTQGFNARSDFFLEPVFSIKLGFKALKLTTQFGFSFPMRTLEEYPDAFEPFIFSMGIQFSLRKPAALKSNR